MLMFEQLKLCDCKVGDLRNIMLIIMLYQKRILGEIGKSGERAE